MFNCHGRQGGNRSVEYQNAYNVARYLSKKLDVLYWQINRGSLLWRIMEDIDKKGWIHVNRKVPTNSIKEGKTMWVWKYDVLLCIWFTFKCHIHILIHLLHHVY